MTEHTRYPSSPLTPTGALRMVKWAEMQFTGDDTQLNVSERRLPVAMPNSPATGLPMVSNGALGADMIRLAAGTGFAPHTHHGDHLLIPIAGEGTISYAGVVYPSRAGELYLIAGNVPHAVGAISDFVLLAIGSPHRAVDDPERATLTAYRELAAASKLMHCLICKAFAVDPDRLHDAGCPHCPCEECNPVEG